MLENRLGRTAAVILPTVALILLATWPFRLSLLDGSIPGGGPDILSTTWGMWWFQQSGLAGWTDLVNFPYGSTGMILCPSSALIWALFEPLLGPGRATLAVDVVQISATSLALFWLSRRIGLGRVGAITAGLSILVGRYFVYELGEASVVAVACLPVILGLGALLRPGLWSAIAVGLCSTWAALENPYLAPLLPAVAGLWFLRDRSRTRALALTLALVGMFGVSQAFMGTANPIYPVPAQRLDQSFTLGPLQFLAIDLPVSRATLTELFWPGEVRWTTGIHTARLAQGGMTLGWTLLLSAGAAVGLARRQAWPWLALGIGGVLLALGSTPGGPFLLLNAVMDAIARPLTQPSRFLVLTIVGLGLAAGITADALRSRWGRQAWLLPAAMLLESILVGGLSLQPPTTPVPQASCVTDLDGPVLVWPNDAKEVAPVASQLLQLRHGQPASHPGIAAWRIQKPKVKTMLYAAGFDAEHDAQPVQPQLLYDLGYRWVLVLTEEQAAPRGLGSPVESCDGIDVYRLQ